MDSLISKKFADGETEVLETERLIIRRFRANDWSDLYEYLSDPQVVKFEPYGPQSVEQCRIEAAKRAEHPAFYAVCLKDNGRLVGNLYLQPSEFNTWEFGFVFNKRYQGQGYATESARALIDFAFCQLNARRITAACSNENERSWKLLERLGMRREGLLLQNVWFKKDSEGNPIWFDSYLYALLDSEWRIGG